MCKVILYSFCSCLVAVCSLAACGSGNDDADNLLVNGSFEVWPNGDKKDPADWNRAFDVGLAERSTVLKRSGAAAIKLTRIDGNVNAYQLIERPVRLKGKSVTCTGWVFCESRNSARLVIQDGVGEDVSVWHSGKGKWEELKVTRLINPNENQFRVILDVSRVVSPLAPDRTTAPVSAFFDDVICVEEPLTVGPRIALANSEYDLYQKLVLALLAVTTVGTILVWRKFAKGTPATEPND